MGTYMTVVLKDKFKNDLFVEILNQELTDAYGSNTGEKFVSWAYLQEEADYMNYHPEGLKMLPHWQRPIAKEALECNFFWYRMGEFSFKISGAECTDEARDAIAVCKWITKTKGKYIDLKRSVNFQPKIVINYLNDIFQEDGYDLQELWRLP